ncbi:MAG TPA: aspartate kinase [Rhodothermales bacterium]|nr:aspartate kinase [Rhodothermales bacterium]
MSEAKGVKVLKFGGTSVGSGEALRRVADIVRSTVQTHRVVLVISAASGVTDLLEAHLQGSYSGKQLVEHLWVRQHVLASGVLPSPALLLYEETLRARLAEVAKQIYGSEHESSAKDDWLRALGERLHAPLVTLMLREAGLNTLMQDAAVLIRTDDTFSNALVDIDVTTQQVRDWHARLPATTVPVVTGFIGGTADGVTTTLGRGGSDYAAALLAASLQATVLERWTDVDGLYTHDPRTNEQAEHLPCIRLEEAWQWNRAGRLGMHRKMLDPLVRAAVPVHIRCTTQPDEQGTWLLPSCLDENVAVAS